MEGTKKAVLLSSENSGTTTLHCFSAAATLVSFLGNLKTFPGAAERTESDFF